VEDIPSHRGASWRRQGRKPTGELVISVKTAYMGDVWVRRMGFAVNLLVHRPSLDNFPPDHAVRFTLEEIVRTFSTRDLTYRRQA
jgi:hypothetical protein